MRCLWGSSIVARFEKRQGHSYPPNRLGWLIRGIDYLGAGEDGEVGALVSRWSREVGTLGSRRSKYAVARSG